MNNKFIVTSPLLDMRARREKLSRERERERIFEFPSASRSHPDDLSRSPPNPAPKKPSVCQCISLDGASLTYREPSQSIRGSPTARSSAPGANSVRHAPAGGHVRLTPRPDNAEKLTGETQGCPVRISCPGNQNTRRRTSRARTSELITLLRSASRVFLHSFSHGHERR